MGAKSLRDGENLSSAAIGHTGSELAADKPLDGVASVHARSGCPHTPTDLVQVNEA
jgi:hypothetical protein